MSELEKLYRETFSGHVKLMTRILGGDHAAGEDVVQEAYARALKYWPSYDPKRGPLKPFFNKILFNALRDIQREYKNRPTEDSEAFSAEDILPNPTHSYDNIIELIETVENTNHQRILYLFFVLGYNSREISQIEEKMTQTNVTTILNRFKESLV